MFYQNWRLALFALIMMPLAALVAKSLGRRIQKAVAQSAKIEGRFNFLFVGNAKRIKDD